VATAFGAAVMMGGCAGPMYAGQPDEMYYSAPRSDERSYVGGDMRDEEVGYDDEQPVTDAAPHEPQYEYRGGRDPITGKAKTRL